MTPRRAAATKRGAGATARATIRPRLYHRAPDGTTRQDLSETEVAAAVRSGEGVLWVDIDVQSGEQHQWLERVFHFHPLAIEDTLNPESRVKQDAYPGYLFVITRGVSLDESTPDPYDLRTENLCFFLGPNYLVTVRRASQSACDEVAAHVEGSPDLLARGAAHLMYLIVDASVDRYFPILDQIDEFVNELEERVFIQCDTSALHEIFRVKRLGLSLRRHLVPMREVLNVLTNRPSALLAPEEQVYFRDVYDHVLRITDSLDTYRELLASTLDSSLSQTSNQLATVTKTLSVLATLSIPFVMVSGIWGMNFAHIPLSDWPHGFLVMLLVQLALGGAMVAVLRWRRLL